MLTTPRLPRRGAKTDSNTGVRGQAKQGSRLVLDWRPLGKVQGRHDRRSGDGRVTRTKCVLPQGPYAWILEEKETAEPGNADLGVEVSRLALPAVEPTVDWDANLDEETVAQTEKVLRRARSELETKGPPQKGRKVHLAEGSTYAELVHRLADTGMHDLVDEKELGCHGVTGAFQVAKTGSSETRFIMNGSGMNSEIVGKLPNALKVELPSPSFWTRLTLNEMDTVEIACADASNFFYSLRAPEDMRALYALPRIPWSSLGQDRPGHAVPVPNGLPMGANLSPVLAHRTMVGIMRKVFDGDDNVLVVGSDEDVPFGFRLGSRVLIVVYIDDVGVIDVSVARANRCLDRLVTGMTEAGVQVRDSKCQRASADRMSTVFLGVAVSRTGTLAMPHEKSIRFRERCKIVAESGTSNGKELSRLVGYAVWAFMLERLNLSSINRLYSEIIRSGGSSETRMVEIAPAAAAELSDLGDAVAATRFCVRRHVFAELTATDASLNGYGISESKDCTVAEILTALTGPALADCGSELGIGTRQWRDVVSAPVRHRTKVILDLELIAILMAARRLYRNRRVRDSHAIFLVDNTAAVSLIRRGRGKQARHRRLLRQLRDVCGGSITIWPVYIGTKSNPADLPSRRYDRPRRMGYVSE